MRVCMQGAVSKRKEKEKERVLAGVIALLLVVDAGCHRHR